MPDSLKPQTKPSDLKVEDLNPLLDEIISRQATINIGTIGHVAHGKSTVVRAISGKNTIRYKTEMVRNITIKLGYANAKIYKCTSEDCPPPSNYTSRGSSHVDEFKCPREGCTGNMKIVRHVSFVDCPGHDILMATMLNGAAVMDGALLLIAGNESCPQPQTSEHLAAVMIMKLQHIIILQNKIDLVPKTQALHQLKEIKHFIYDSKPIRNAPILPISAQMKLNVDAVSQHLAESIPVPPRDFTSSARMIVIRSFDVNKPGEEIEDLKGGVAGGSILRGVLKLGQKIEVRPGVVTKVDRDFVCKPILSQVVSLFAEENTLNYAVPGGLIGVGTKIDPTLTRADRLVGQVIGDVGSLPDIFIEIEINFFLLTRLLGVKSTDGKNSSKVQPLSRKEAVMVNIGSTSVGATVIGVRADLAKLSLFQPVCTSEGEKIALSRRIQQHWRLIGWGTIKSGKSSKIENI